ncbi:alpha/beta hydrolase [Paenibacillus piri]|uniref:Alpha/beta hydrolase n=2 Tax=Paenibacillus piri TaxID=2547395 RepID=A0A4R5KHM6_9BACL|nr:alpha/beta hydrolase [Paenibacillus piri]
MEPYKPDAAALEAMKGGEGVAVTESKEWIIFEPGKGKKAEPDILFYPGGLVRPESYAPLALSLAKEGLRAWIVKMPLNLAIFGEDRASRVIETEPGRDFIIGGHSLGGVVAARYAVKHPEHLKGVYLLASYTDRKGNLRGLTLPVLSIVGTLDGVLNGNAFEQGKRFLPDKTEYAEITGGNHAQFGSYGKQKNDNPASIPSEKQLSITVSLIVNWLERLEPPGGGSPK